MKLKLIELCSFVIHYSELPNVFILVGRKLARLEYNRRVRNKPWQLAAAIHILHLGEQLNVCNLLSPTLCSMIILQTAVIRMFPENYIKELQTDSIWSLLT